MSDTQHESPVTHGANRTSASLPWPLALAAATLLGIGLGAIAFVASLLWKPPPLPGPDIAAGAERMLIRMHGTKISEPLEETLREWRRYVDPTQSHQLLKKEAPDFSLETIKEGNRSLASYLKNGPVVLVFYYGYYCDHCVAQLYALNNDIALFRELGAEVIAISADPVSETIAKYTEYKKRGGAFLFPVMSDPKNKVAELYGCFTPEKGDQPELQLHGTFLIDKEGIVRWAHTGLSPYTNNRSLLGYLASMQGIELPEANPADANKKPTQ